jgi:Xaa-Pro aminopeptidase
MECTASWQPAGVDQRTADLTDLYVSTFQALAFAPDGGFLYVNYTDLEGNTNVVEFAMGSDGRATVGSRREILFVKDRDPVQEHWRGHLLSAVETRARSGIDSVLTTSRFEPFIEAILGRQPSDPVSAQDAARFFDALSARRAQLAVTAERGRESADAPSPPVRFARRMLERFGNFETTDPTAIFDDLRTVKTPYERRVLVKSLEISSDAQMAGMRAARPGAHEYEVKASVEAVHRARGAVSWSYPSIVGSGPNATILHYPDGDRQMQAGELLLVDAACNFGYMSGDITRTYPVNGTFSAAQKDLYRLVLQASHFLETPIFLH